MTTLVILILGAAAILWVNAFDHNPDGSDVSLLQTIRDIWNDNLSFQNGTLTSGSSTANNPFGTQGTPNGVPPGLGNNRLPLTALTVPNNPAGGPSGNQYFIA